VDAVKKGKHLAFSSGSGGVEPSPLLLRLLIGLLYLPQMMTDDDEYGAVGGVLSGGNRSTQRKPAIVSLCSPQIPHELTCARTRVAAAESRRLTA
jgi:hypothetical protein